MVQMPMKSALALLLASAATAASAAPAELAFVSIRSGDPQIFVRDGEQRVRALTEGRSLAAQPALAPSGRLAYTVRDGAHTRIVITDDQGRSPEVLTNIRRFESSPSWSPDGRLLAFFARTIEDGTKVALVVVDVATRQEKALAGIVGDMGPTAPSWSADGQRLAYVAATGRRGHVFVVGLDGGAPRNISEGFASRGGVTPQISPDGKRVAWIADLQARTPVVVTDLETGQTRDLTPESLAACETPRWSPDGERIAFVSLRDTYGAGRNDVFVMKADGTEMRNVTQHEAEDFNPRWSSDGGRLFYTSLRTGTSLIFELNLATGATRPVSVHGSHDMDHVTRPVAQVKASAGATTR